jgi:hypothetical protein
MPRAARCRFRHPPSARRAGVRSHPLRIHAAAPPGQGAGCRRPTRGGPAVRAVQAIEHWSRTCAAVSVGACAALFGCPRCGCPRCGCDAAARGSGVSGAVLCGSGLPSVSVRACSLPLRATQRAAISQAPRMAYSPVPTPEGTKETYWETKAPSSDVSRASSCCRFPCRCARSALCVSPQAGRCGADLPRWAQGPGARDGTGMSEGRRKAAGGKLARILVHRD